MDEVILSWATEYDRVRKSPPEEGDYLSTTDGSPIRLEIILEQGKTPLVLARCFVPQLVGCKLGWFCRSVNDPLTRFGWKCIVMPRAREELIRKKGLSNPFPEVQTLIVLRTSISNAALMVDIAEW